MSNVCPYCGICFPSLPSTEVLRKMSFEHSSEQTVTIYDSVPVYIKWAKCPRCDETSLSVFSPYGGKYSDVRYHYPPIGIIQLPTYIPEAIRNDYKEAVSIIELSPKAAATLARRCLQGMIRDFWGIKEKTLNAEISQLKDKVPAAQWNAIDALRKVGNIGAHMEKDVELIVDVEPDEATKLIKLIELLLQKWYVARHDEEQLFAEIAEMSAEKENQRKSVLVDADS